MSDTPVDSSKRTWLIASGCAGAVGGVAVAVPFVSTFQPSEKAKAAGAAVEADISALKPGEKMTVEWRGKPVWIVKRTPEQLAELRQLIDHSIESWTSVLKNHQVEQTKLITEHESNMRKILRQNEGVWYSDFWMKVLVISLLVYTMGLGLVVYCIT